MVVCSRSRPFGTFLLLLAAASAAFLHGIGIGFVQPKDARALPSSGIDGVERRNRGLDLESSRRGALCGPLEALLPRRRPPSGSLVAMRAGAPKPPWSHMKDRPIEFKRRFSHQPIPLRKAAGKSNRPKVGQNWTDFTRIALGIDDQVIAEGEEEQAENPMPPLPYERDRRCSMGIDFGPQFTGLSMSYGGVNTQPLGTLKTDGDWKRLVLTIAQIASTRRVRDIVVGLPLEKDGTEGKIAKLVRHFSKMLADAVLLLLGGHVAVYLWDERFSTLYAAMRLYSRPRFDGAIFKSWLDSQRGLETQAKAMLDCEASRAILEHWLEKDEATGIVNKERSERVPPSREACVSYLTWKKSNKQKVRMPEEPTPSGIDWFDYQVRFPEVRQVSLEDYEKNEATLRKVREGTGDWGNRKKEYLDKVRERNEINRRKGERYKERPPWLKETKMPDYS